MDPRVAPNEMQSAKRALREEMRGWRSSVSSAAAARAGAGVAAVLAVLLDRLGLVADSSSQIPTVLLYAALPGEPDTAPLDAALRTRGFLVAYPRIDGARLAVHLARPDDLQPGRYRLREPSASSPEPPLATLALVLVPGLAFDRRGHRLGFGRGYYDRLLAATPDAVRCGVCYERQLCPSIPIEPHDVSLDFLLCAADAEPPAQAALFPTHARGLPRGLSDIEEDIP